MISVLSDDENKLSVWDDFVVKHPMASHYHLSTWSKIIKTVFQHSCFYFYAQDSNGSIQGVLPLVRLKSRLFGDYMVSMPYFNYGGALGLDKDVELELMCHAASEADRLGVKHIEFRDTISREGYPCNTDKVSMLLELPDSEELLWKQLGAKRRSQIKRPLRENPDIMEGGLELLDDFYTVFAQNMRDLGTPVYAKSFFAAILTCFPKDARLVIIYLKGKPVGAAFLIGFKARLEIPWASTLKEVNALSINMLMYWEVLRYAYRAGYQIFDFGRCTVESGTYRFKKQWGGKAKQYYWHYHLSSGTDVPQLNNRNPKYQMLIKAWQKTPLFITNTVGPHIVKNLP